MEDCQEKDAICHRMLKLKALVGEDWGKVQKHTNDFLFKDWALADAEAALTEIRKMSSPLHELEALLIIEAQKLLRNEKEE